MSLVEPPSQKPGDDLDDLLRTFFRAQMPHPWPSSPSPRPRVAPAKQSLARRRWTLAASIALLLGGTLLLPAHLTPPNRPLDALNGPLLNDNGLRRQMEKEHQRKEIDKQHKSSLGVEDADLLPDLSETDLLPFK